MEAALGTPPTALPSTDAALPPWVCRVMWSDARPPARRSLARFYVKVTGKWFNYGIIFMVMILDINMTKNQIVYIPADYGQ